MAVMENSASLTSLVELLQGVEQRELFLEYQAVFDIGTGAVRGAEALIRWDHPARGVLPPAEFLAMAMRGGLGGLITSLVLEEAVAQCAEWRIRGCDVPVSVNVSAAAFAGTDLPGTVDAVLDEVRRPTRPPHRRDHRTCLHVREHRTARHVHRVGPHGRTSEPRRLRDG